MDGQSHGNDDGRADGNGDADDNGVGIDVNSSGTRNGTGAVDHGMRLDVFYGFTEHVIKQLEKVRTETLPFLSTQELLSLSFMF